MFNSTNNFEKEFENLVRNIYDINFDNNNLKASLKLAEDRQPKYFDELRKKYRIRREFKNYKVNLTRQEKFLIERLQSLRFNVT